MFNSFQALQNSNEKEELKKTLEESERKRASKDVEISELGDMLDEIRRSNDTLISQKIKLQTDLELLQVRPYGIIRQSITFMMSG